MIRFLRKVGLSLGVFALAGCGAYLIASNSTSTTEIDIGNEATELTNQQRFIQELSDIKAFALDADLNVTYKSNDYTAKFTGEGNLEDLSDIQFEGALKAQIGASKIDCELTYLSSVFYLSALNSHFKMASDGLFDFVEMLPVTYPELNIGVPDAIKDLDVNALIAKIEDMKEVSDTLVDGGHLFVVELEHFDDEDSSNDIDLYLKSDAEFNFTGLRTSRFFYKDFYIQLLADISQPEASEVTIVNPSLVEGAPVYYDFDPAYTLFSDIYGLFQSRTHTLGYELTLTKDKTVDGVTETNDFLKVSGDASIDAGDKDNTRFDIGVNVASGDESSDLHAFYEDQQAFISYNDVIKLSVHSESIHAVFNYVIDRLMEGKTIDDLLGSMSDLTDKIDIDALLNGDISLTDFIGGVTISKDRTEITIDLSQLEEKFDFSIGKIIIDLDSKGGALSSLSLSGLKYSGYGLNAKIEIKDYQAFGMSDETKDGFVAIDSEETPILNLVSSIYELSQKQQFRLEFEADVTATDKEPIAIDGGFQFDIGQEGQSGFGYGKLDLTDRDSYLHEVKVDVVSRDDMYFSYNEDLNGHFSTKTLTGIFDVCSTIYKDKDDHFMELFGDLLAKMEDTGIGRVMAGDISPLLNKDVIKSFNITSTIISISMSGAIMGLDGDINVEIGYKDTDDNATLNYLSLKDLKVGDNTISFTLSLRDFDSSFASKDRLDLYQDYLDFSNIKVLLELGLATSRYDDYRFTGNVTLSLLGSELGNIGLDLRIKNEHGDVSVSADLTDIPIINLLNGNENGVLTRNREAHIYYQGDYVYIERTEQYKTGFIFGSYKDYSYKLKSTKADFSENVLAYLLQGVLGIKDSMMDMIIGDDSGDTGSTQIHYEKVLMDFNYNEAQHYFMFKINLEELAGTSVLKPLTLYVYTNDDASMLSSLSLSLSISVLVTIPVSANLTFVDIGEEVDLTAFNAFILSASGMTENTPIITK